MNIKAISGLEYNYNLKNINRFNVSTPAMNFDCVEINSGALSFKGVDRKSIQAYRKLAKSHAQDANVILNDSDSCMRRMRSELGFCNVIKSEAEAYKSMALFRYEYAKALLRDAEGQLLDGQACGVLTFSDGTKGNFICFEQDDKKGLTLVKQDTVVTLFDDKLTMTNRVQNGLEQIFTYDKDGNVQKVEQNVGGAGALYKNLEINYENGELTEYKEKDSMRNHYLKKYICEGGKITKAYISCYEDAKGCLHAGDAYSFEDENRPVLFIGFHDNQDGNTSATSEFSFAKVGKDEYKLNEFKFRTAKNPEGKVEASKIYKYDNDKLKSMSIGQFVSQSGREVVTEHYLCDENGRPYDVLLNAKADEEDSNFYVGDEHLHLSLASALKEQIEDFKMSWLF